MTLTKSPAYRASPTPVPRRRLSPSPPVGPDPSHPPLPLCAPHVRLGNPLSGLSLGQLFSSISLFVSS